MGLNLTEKPWRCRLRTACLLRVMQANPGVFQPLGEEFLGSDISLIFLGASSCRYYSLQPKLEGLVTNTIVLSGVLLSRSFKASLIKDRFFCEVLLHCMPWD